MGRGLHHCRGGRRKEKEAEEEKKRRKRSTGECTSNSYTCASISLRAPWNHNNHVNPRFLNKVALTHWNRHTLHASHFDWWRDLVGIWFFTTWHLQREAKSPPYFLLILLTILTLINMSNNDTCRSCISTFGSISRIPSPKEKTAISEATMAGLWMMQVHIWWWCSAQNILNGVDDIPSASTTLANPLPTVPFHNMIYRYDLYWCIWSDVIKHPSYYVAVNLHWYGKSILKSQLLSSKKPLFSFFWSKGVRFWV